MSDQDPDRPLPRPVRMIVRPRPVPRPDLRLVLLHHAGGSAAAYRGWAGLFPPSWDVCLVELPGRGRLAGVPAVTDAAALVERLVGQLRPLADQPFAVFGHSMGALLGYGLAAALGPSAVWLGLSSLPVPRFDGTPAPVGLYRLSGPALRSRLVELGGVPPAALADDAVWALVEPLVRQDIAVCASWRPGPAYLPMRVPVSVFYGRDDAVAGARETAGWSGRVSRCLGAHGYPGGHFYLQRQPAEVVRQIVADVRVARGG
jgi:surfactin synthase thioesterase subunit